MNWIPKIEYIQNSTTVSFIFDSPPEGDPLNEKYSDSKIITKTNDGSTQTQFNYTTISYDIDFIFQSQSVKNNFLTFIGFAKKGSEFKFFSSNDESDYVTVRLESRNHDISRPIPNGVGDFEYNLSFTLSRVI